MLCEVQIMHHLAGHLKVVELHGAYEDRHSVNLVMELCKGGELFDRIIERGTILSAPQPRSPSRSSPSCITATPWV
ncbi:hypothetical protein HPP92_023638 [Vanilla planifolia]|uniref:Protein kinase domain-containing protein n=1 Tax=Vanilla planifolia TaxID=51239 RepID=A0A835PNU3_VANPL|nr:hypothetical protein HPP92_023638 [Vanilla planifolia]